MKMATTSTLNLAAALTLALTAMPAQAAILLYGSPDTTTVAAHQAVTATLYLQADPISPGNPLNLITFSVAPVGDGAITGFDQTLDPFFTASGNPDGSWDISLLPEAAIETQLVQLGTLHLLSGESDTTFMFNFPDAPLLIGSDVYSDQDITPVNIQVNTIPEPTVAAPLLLTAAMAGLRRRRA